MMDGVAVSDTVREAPEDEAKPSGPVDADADIFGEAGRNYVPEFPTKTNGKPLDIEVRSTGAQQTLPLKHSMLGTYKKRISVQI